MKKSFKKSMLKYMLSAVMIACCSVTALANDTPKGLSELSDYHKQLQKEYQIAVDEGDVERQNFLIKEADGVLDEMIEQADKLPVTKSNPFGTTYYDYFSKSVWITRDVVSLSIYPINLAWPSSQIETAWQFIVDRHSSDSHWDNEKIMRKQFWCHVNFAGSMKTPWNIEPHKTSINPITCN